jgi:tetraacyldisaccharide 4'-kinase
MARTKDRIHKGWQLNQEYYRKLISGANNGLCAAVLRFFLGIAARVYSIAVRLRNFLYSKGWLKTHSANVPVISVGNVTAGGTGKTPLVIWLCKFLQQKEFRLAVLTRGYKTHTKERGTRDEGRGTKIDEPAILNESCPDAKVIVNPNRVAGAVEAVGKFGAKVLIMDDGFQHRRLARDLDIVTIDATCPFGYGKMLLAGLLREPVASLKRADAAVIARCDQTSKAKLSQIEEKLQSINPNMIIAKSIHAAVCIKYMDSCLRRNDNVRRNDSLEELKDKKIFAFCGIGNPDVFFNTITKLGANLVGSKIYNDHHYYTNSDIDDIYKQARRLEADLVLTTQKDFSKLKIQNSKFKIQLAYLAIELKFISGEDKLKQLIENTLAGKISRQIIVNSQ